MTTRNIIITLTAMVGLLFTSCNKDELNGESIFKSDLEQQANESEFDKWLEKNYRQPYNIQLHYRYIDNESDRSYNVVPADYEKSKALAILVKHMWLDAYTELMGEAFLKQNAPRIIQLTGSYKYQQNESGESGGVVMGTAEGGLKVMLYGINSLDPTAPYINTTDPYSSDKWNTTKLDMNHWYFHTMHHEFCHILTQKKEYSTEFRTITAADYHASDWINLTDKQVAKEGFVTAYASMEYNEDFAEIYSTYVTMTPAAWKLILTEAGEKGAPIIEKKLKILKDYFKNSWQLDIDQIRDIVLRRSGEVTTLDLKNLN